MNKREQLAAMRLEEFKAHLRTIAGEDPKAEINGAPRPHPSLVRSRKKAARTPTIDLRNLSAHARAKGRSLKIEPFIIVAGIFGLRQEVAKLCRLTAIQTRPTFVIDPDHACPNKRACSDVVCLLVT